ncbi:hypothetical protein N619_13885 [Ectopseudomonas oleovorans]|nr:hypothetical protein N619_13850 [Pseudomonas oleovorans]KJU79199.1 hypothetical protein N619_13885 [Pseudomonas oleovorans]
MIKNLKIFTDLNDDKTYAYCTYDLMRNRGLHKESFRIELLFTDIETGKNDFKAGKPVYDIRFLQSIESRRLKFERIPEPITFGYVSRGYDQHTILDFIGDSPEHRDFLAQVGIHD